MKTSFWVLTSSLICFTALKADMSAEPIAENSATPITAAQQSMPQPQSQAQPTGKMSCMKANNPHRIDIKHIEAKGIGYNQGYTSLDGFFTSMWNDFIPFLDLRAHLFNNGRWAANAGLGARYIFDPCHWMVGGNVYYDYRNTKHGNYNQIGAGVEAFYDLFEAHLNGYLPVGQKRTITQKNLESVTFKGFSGNYILQNENYRNTYEGAMKGFNGELGAHIAGDRKCYDLYFGVGPYYYDVSSGRHAWGGKARLKAEVTKYLFLEVSDSYDRIFHNRVQGTVNVSIPFGGKLCYPSKNAQKCSNVMDWQAVLPVERQEIIVVSKFKKKHTIDPVAINPATGQPYFVLFVNNTNTNLGDGTFENPFANLTNLDNPTSAENAAMDGNIIYVFAGDGSATGMMGGNMQLQPNNRLLGSANSHPFQTTKGLLTVPALTTLIPHVQGPQSAILTNNIINLGDNCEVSGFNIAFVPFLNPTFGVACIAGVPVSGTLLNAFINNNTLLNGSYGVNLGTTTFPVTGTVVIENNTAANQAHSSSVAAFSYVISGVQNANLTIANNIAQNIISGQGMAVVPLGNVTANITGNTLESVLRGLELFDQTVDPTVSNSVIFKNNYINNTSDAGFIITSRSTVAGTGSTAVIFEENQVLNEAVQSSITIGTPRTFCVRFNNNTGYPGAILQPFLIDSTGVGTLNLEPPLNNFPQPAVGTVTSVSPCFCGQPCN